MFTIQLLSLQIDISWSKKTSSENKLSKTIHTNNIEKQMNDMKAKCYQYIRYM